MLSDIRHDNRISFCLTMQFFDDSRSGQSRLIIFQRELLFHPVDLRDPVSVLSPPDQRI